MYFFCPLIGLMITGCGKEEVKSEKEDGISEKHFLREIDVSEFPIDGGVTMAAYLRYYGDTAQCPPAPGFCVRDIVVFPFAYGVSIDFEKGGDAITKVFLDLLKLEKVGLMKADT